MPTYEMFRYEVVAPTVDNSGKYSGYAADFRSELPSIGITGWTEFQTAGYWHGKMEPGTTFLIFSPYDITRSICKLARKCMPDQDAIQVTVANDLTKLVEA